MSTSDNVNHPYHYEGSTSIECIEAMRLIFEDEGVGVFCLCNAFKYLWRHKNKNGIEDLRKAQWYLKEYEDLCYCIDDYIERYRILKKLVDDAYEAAMGENPCTEPTD